MQCWILNKITVIVGDPKGNSAKVLRSQYWWMMCCVLVL